jgi:hypothetical protein
VARIKMDSLQQQITQLNSTVYQLQDRLGKNQLMTANLWRIQAAVFVILMQVTDLYRELCPLFQFSFCILPDVRFISSALYIEYLELLRGGRKH